MPLALGGRRRARATSSRGLTQACWPRIPSRAGARAFAPLRACFSLHRRQCSISGPWRHRPASSTAHAPQPRPSHARLLPGRGWSLITAPRCRFPQVLGRSTAAYMPGQSPPLLLRSWRAPRDGWTRRRCRCGDPMRTVSRWASRGRLVAPGLPRATPARWRARAVKHLHAVRRAIHHSGCVGTMWSAKWRCTRSARCGMARLRCESMRCAEAVFLLCAGKLDGPLTSLLNERSSSASFLHQ